MLRLVDKAAIAWMNWRRRRQIKNSPDLKDFKVEEIIANEQGLDITVTSKAVAWIANELARLLVAHNAKNYVQMDMVPSMDVADKPVRITVEWAYGESPAAKAERLEKELRQLKIVTVMDTEALMKAHHKLVGENGKLRETLEDLEREGGEE